MKKAIFVEQIHSFVQNFMANFLKKCSSLSDENSRFYTENTICSQFVVGRYLPFKVLLKVEKYTKNEEEFL
jgi:hypothetical protein